MSIPESDHQMIANLIAFASLIITAIVIIYCLHEIRKAKQIALQANHIANKANLLIQEALYFSKSEQKNNDLPHISVRLLVSKISRISAEFDIITFTFINESANTVTLDCVNLTAPFKGQIDSPTKLKYKEETKIRIYIDEKAPSFFSDIKRSNSDDIDTLRQKVEETLINSIITLIVVNEINIHYEIDLRYNTSVYQFEGIPIQVRYLSKMNTEKNL